MLENILNDISKNYFDIKTPKGKFNVMLKLFKTNLKREFKLQTFFYLIKLAILWVSLGFNSALIYHRFIAKPIIVMKTNQQNRK